MFGSLFKMLSKVRELLHRFRFFVWWLIGWYHPSVKFHRLQDNRLYPMGHKGECMGIITKDKNVDWNFVAKSYKNYHVHYLRTKDPNVPAFVLDLATHLQLDLDSPVQHKFQGGEALNTLTISAPETSTFDLSSLPNLEYIVMDHKYNIDPNQYICCGADRSLTSKELIEGGWREIVVGRILTIEEMMLFVSHKIEDVTYRYECKRHYTRVAQILLLARVIPRLIAQVVAPCKCELERDNVELEMTRILKELNDGGCYDYNGEPVIQKRRNDIVDAYYGSKINKTVTLENMLITS